MERVLITPFEIGSISISYWYSHKLGDNMSPIYDQSQAEKTFSMIPEAILWKRTILAVYFQFVFEYSEYIKEGKDWSQKDNLQGSVIKLFIALRPKIKKEEMKGSLKQLEEYLMKPPSKFTMRQKALTIEFIYTCFKKLQDVMERLKITVPETEQQPLEKTFTEE